MSDKPIDVRGIVWGYLKAHGYDGLYSEDIECGCDLADLMPCEGCWEHCRPGYTVQIEGCLVEIRPEKPGAK